jgi:translation elongation factor EF-1alpha
MKINARLIVIATLTLTVSSCSKKDTTQPFTVECFADRMTFIHKTVKDYPSGHNVFLTFAIKNTSTKDYDIERGAKLLSLKVDVSTTDSAHYETNIVFTRSSIAAGDSAVAMVSANYGAGKTYAGYKVIAACY